MKLTRIRRTRRLSESLTGMCFKHSDIVGIIIFLSVFKKGGGSLFTRLLSEKGSCFSSVCMYADFYGTCTA